MWMSLLVYLGAGLIFLASYLYFYRTVVTTTLRGLIQVLIHLFQTNMDKLSGRSLIANPTSYTLCYHVGTRKYSIVFPKVRGPVKFLEVSVETPEGHVNVTNNILEYAGVCHNFHNIPTTPKLLGYDNLKFKYLDGREIHYQGDAVIYV